MKYNQNLKKVKNHWSLVQAPKHGGWVEGFCNLFPLFLKAQQNCFYWFTFVSRLIGISNMLPQTTGIKMIEVWLIVCLVTSFFDTLLQTYIHYWVCIL
jgi:hypothetical protein